VLKMAEPIKMPFGVMDSGGPKEECITWAQIPYSKWQLLGKGHTWAYPTTL